MFTEISRNRIAKFSKVLPFPVTENVGNWVTDFVKNTRFLSVNELLYKWCDGDVCDSKGMWMNLDKNLGKYKVISTESKHNWAPAQCNVKES